MALVLADRVRETTTTTGTGSVTLAGAYTGFQTFSSAVGNGNSTYYTIANVASGEWEVGIGSYASGGNLLSRTTVLASSNGGSLVNFGAGVKDAFVTQPAERALYIASAGTGLESKVTAFTNGGIVYASSTSALATGSALTWNGSALAVTGTLSTTGNITNSNSAGRLDFTGGSSAQVWATASSLYLDAATGQSVIIRPNNQVTVGTFSSTGLAITPGVLTLGQNLVYDAFINSPESMYFNVDSDANSSNQSFIFGTDRAGTTGGTEFMRISGATGGVGAVGIGYSSLTSVGNNGLAVLGNVGIGTSSPGYKLDVLGNVNRFAGASVDGIFLSTVAATDTSYYGANYYNNNGTEGVNASGRASWRIATLTAGSPTFSIGYRAASAGAGTFSTPLTIDASGNLGLGVTPSTWTNLKVLESGYSSSFGGNIASSVTYVVSNGIFNGGWLYKTTGSASYYRVDGSTGSHVWYNAPSGTAGNAITFTQAMTLDAGGKLLLGVTSGTGLSNSDFAMGNGNHIRFRNAANSAYISAFEFTSANGLNIGTGGSLSTITFGISGIGEAGRFDTSGNLLVGATSSTGSVSNNANLIGGIVNTYNGNSSITTSPTTVVTLPSRDGATYIFSCQNVSDSGATTYGAVALITQQTTALVKTDLQTASFTAITISGLDIRITSTLATKTYKWSLVRIL